MNNPRVGLVVPANGLADYHYTPPKQSHTVTLDLSTNPDVVKLLAERDELLTALKSRPGLDVGYDRSPWSGREVRARLIAIKSARRATVFGSLPDGAQLIVDGSRLHYRYPCKRTTRRNQAVHGVDDAPH